MHFPISFSALCYLLLPNYSQSFSWSPSSLQINPQQHQKVKTAVNLSQAQNFLKLKTRSSCLRSTNNSNGEEISAKVNERKTPKDEYDVIIVGSGIGGLTAAAMLSLYGYKVAVFESHYLPGGAAHGFTMKSKVDNNDTVQQFHFDTGPSFFSGLNPTIPAKTSNPLRTVLDAIGESVECEPYTTFGLHFPEGSFVHSVDFGKEKNVIDQISGKRGVEQWYNLLEKEMVPIAEAVAAMPTAALRVDLGALLTAGPYFPNFAKISNPFAVTKLTKPFSSVVKDAGVTDSFVKNWLDLLCFCLSGLPADGTITAEMGLMLGEFYEPDAIMDSPKGGAKSIIDALVRGIEKHGGEIFLSNHVSKININDDKVATGVEIKSKNNKPVSKIKAKKAVISNLSVWDMFSTEKKENIVDLTKFPDSFIDSRQKTPLGKSFMHLHVGFKMSREELDKLQAHYMFIDDWSRGVAAEDNAVLLSIPSVHDETLAPEGHAVLHIYTPATEDYSRWSHFVEEMKYSSDYKKLEEYKKLKEERSLFLWETLEKVIPDIKERVVISQVGTPLTHQRFLNRFKGSYGPAIVAGDESFPFPMTPVKNLLLCGDSCFPGIGVPAVAGSGLIAANSVSLSSVKPHLKVLEKLKNNSYI